MVGITGGFEGEDEGVVMGMERGTQISRLGGSVGEGELDILG